jgi:protein SCO1/2
MKSSWSLIAAALVLLSQAAAPAGAQNLAPILREIGIDQKLDEQLPLDLTFKDQSGKTVQLRDYFGDKPVLLSFAYYECPMLCTLVLNGAVKAMRAMPLELGRDFVAVNISFNPREGPELAAAKRETYLREYGKPAAREAWHFLTGDEENIRRATQAAGFRYVWDEATQQYAHASAIMVLTPEGKFARYFYGIEYIERDLRLGLVEAASGKIGSKVDQVLLLCFHYDPMTGKYGLMITRVIQVLGSATALVLGSFVILMLRRERRKQVPQPGTQA